MQFSVVAILAALASTAYATPTGMKFYGRDGCNAASEYNMSVFNISTVLTKYFDRLRCLYRPHRCRVRVRRRPGWC